MKSDSHPVNPAPPLWPIILAAGIVLGLSLASGTVSACTSCRWCSRSG
ncbi:Uncharacterised protein [Bordetella pertussis]|nr:Uncharacterised protein [Bordetella pertussis]